MNAPPVSMRPDTWRPDIAGLRGLSVLLVVAYHLQLRGAGGGFIGVDVFFVISGYLMTRIIWSGVERGDFHVGRYLLARALRIWPALAALIGLLLVFGAWWLPPADLETLATQAARSLVFWSNQFFLDRSGYNTQSADTHWLLHTWSLSVEWQFYLLFPLLLMGLGRWTRRRSVALSAILLLAAASFAWHLSLGSIAPASAFFLLTARGWELLVGGAAYLLPVRAELPRRAGWSWLGLGLILASALWLAVRRVPAVGSGIWLIGPVVGAALVLAARDAHQRVLGLAPLQALGRWSYSIYLWHWPLIVALRMTDAFLDHPWLAAAAVAAASVVLGALSYRFIEAPAGRSTRRWVWPVASMATAACLAVVGIMTAGLAFRAHGQPSWAAYQASVRASYYPEHCSNFMKTAEATKVCPVDKGTLPRILVIGDSHAEHLYPWFVAHSAVSVDFFTQAECPPVPHLDRAQAGFHCGDYARAAWRKALSGPYDTLVLASYWPNIGLDGAPYCHQPEGETTCTPVTVAEKQALIRRELEAAMLALTQAGKTVVMVAPTPEARVRVPERVERERFWYGEVRLRIDERVVAQKSGWLGPLFAELQGVERFHLVSFNGELCREGVCPVFDPELQRPIYIDENHLDPVWITRHGGALAPFAQAR